MKVREITKTAEGLYARMKDDGYSLSVIDTTKWIIGHFEKYCLMNSIVNVGVPVISKFLMEQYDIDYQSPGAGMQTVLRRPLLILIEFYESGNYCKTHQRGSTTEIPLIFAGFFMAYRDFVNQMNCGFKSKKRKLWTVTNYLYYLEREGIKHIADIKVYYSHKYLNTLASYAPETKRVVASIIREMYEWMYDKKMIAFSGRDAFPLIRKAPKSDILSYYTKDEIKTILSAIDTTGAPGKTAYFIVSITAFLGIRAGDLINLKVNDIDWENNRINIIQQKTGTPITLPLIDEVKYPLLDYLKNARHDSEDLEYILITGYAPYTRINCTSSIYRRISNCIKNAGVANAGRKRGPHALRHSLATNLMKENVPLSAISNILGHSSTRTTEIYLSVDETNLKELSLEVEDVL
jgi:integrase